MAANTAPVYTLTPFATPINVSAANTNRDGTGTIATIYTPGTNGGRLDWLNLQATVTTTAGVFRVWVRAAAAGTWFLIAEILVEARTPSATVQAWSYRWKPEDALILANGNLVGGSMHVAENVVAFPQAADF